MKLEICMKRIGRYCVDKAVLDEGYRLEDIFEMDPDFFGLVEVFDLEERRHVGWMLCPSCGETPQIDLRELICSGCGWQQKEIEGEEYLKCAG